MAHNTLATSDNVILSIAGTGTAALSVSSGEYQLNNSGNWTTTAGTAKHGNAVRVRHNSAGNFSIATDTTLTVGSESDTFTSTTIASGTIYSGQTATGSGGATTTLSGGGPGCAFTSASFLPLSAVPAVPPYGYGFLHGLFDFTASGCDLGGSITVTLTYATALDPATVYWKYGPTAEGPDGQPSTGDDGQSHWYTIDATVAVNQVSFTVTDGGRGDDDLMANGEIVDQGGPGEPAPTPAIPTLSEWSRLVLGLLLMVFGVGALVRRQGQDARS